MNKRWTTIERIVSDGILTGYIADDDWDGILILPDEVVEIKECVFQGNTQIKKLICHSNLKKICASAFENCVNLQEVHFNEGLEEIGKSAFRFTNIKNIDLPDSLKTLDEWCFFIKDAVPSIRLTDCVEVNANSFSRGKTMIINNQKNINLKEFISNCKPLFMNEIIIENKLPRSQKKSLQEYCRIYDIKIRFLNKQETRKQNSDDFLKKSNNHINFVINNGVLTDYIADDDWDGILEIPDNVKEISSAVFQKKRGIPRIKSVYLNNDLKKIGGFAFINQNLEVLRISDNTNILGYLMISSLKHLIINNINNDSTNLINMINRLQVCLQDFKRIKKITIENELTEDEKRNIINLFKDSNIEFLDRPRNKTPNQPVSITNSKINELLENIRKQAIYLSDQDKNWLYEQIDTEINNYKNSLENIKPTLDFKEKMISLTTNITNPKIIEANLISYLELLNYRLSKTEVYKALYERYQQILSILNENPEEPKIIETTLDKVKYLVYYANKLNNNYFKDELSRILENEEKSLKSLTIKSTSDEDFRLIMPYQESYLDGEIDKLYLKLKNNYSNLVTLNNLANIIPFKENTKINKIVSILYVYQKDFPEYQEKFLNILANYQQDTMSLIMQDRINLEKELLESRLLRDLKTNLPDIFKLLPFYQIIYALYKCINKNYLIKSGAIFDYVKDINNVLNEELFKNESTQIANQLNSILASWLNKCKNPDEVLKNSNLINNKLYQGHYKPLEDNALELERLILKDLWTLKNQVETYLNNLMTYEEITRSLTKL